MITVTSCSKAHFIKITYKKIFFFDLEFILGLIFMLCPLLHIRLLLVIKND